MNRENNDHTASDTIRKYVRGGLHLTEMVEEIALNLKSLSANLKISAYSDHQNGLSVLRCGTKPGKDEGTKQSFNVAVAWNSWAEAKGVGDRILTIRFILRGEISREAENYLKSLSAEAAEMNLLVEQLSDPHRASRQALKVKWGIVAAGEKSLKLLSDIELFADSRMPVLISGETGCGKELVANALHNASERKGRFFAVNCAAIPKELIESELFGHLKGSFTGASNGRDGYFQAAHQGTLFLDEIGELSLDLQAKLLRVLQEQKVRRVGSNVDEAVKIRVVAATNRNLREMVKNGDFREDLYFRLNGLILNIEPLRRRAEEIPQLIEFLLKKLSEELGREIAIEEKAVSRLIKHDFPGNVREMVNLLEAGAVFAQENTIGIRHLRINGEIEEEVPETSETTEAAGIIGGVVECQQFESRMPDDAVKDNLINMFKGKTYDEIQDEINCVILKNALDECGGQINRAAQSLGMERSTFSRYAKKWNLINKKESAILPVHLNSGSGQGGIRAMAA